MKGSIRWRDGAWRIQVSATDPITGKRTQPQRTVKAPNNRNGRREAESELAKFIVEIEGRKAAPLRGLTVAQVLERYVVARSPEWPRGASGETRRRIAQHITPYIDDTRVDRLRPIDVQHLIDRSPSKSLRKLSRRSSKLNSRAFRSTSRWEWMRSI